MDWIQVVLNVGGHKYTTSLLTLRNAPESLFNAMFSGRHHLKKDDEGCYFIDRWVPFLFSPEEPVCWQISQQSALPLFRDGRHFHDILNFLRDGHFSYPPDGKDYK